MALLAPSRLFHVNVNCRDLDRSLAFYRDVVGLRQGPRTRPDAPQPGAAFGLAAAQWDAWILLGDAGYDAPALDLLQWIVPPPTGAPATDPTQTGLNRLCFTTPDLDALYARLRAAGADCWSAPGPGPGPGPGRGPGPLDVAAETPRPRRMFIGSDPDGTLLEFVEGPDTRLSRVVVNCADVDRSVWQYQDLLGMLPAYEAVFAPQDGSLFRVAGGIAMRARGLRDVGSGCVVELMEWRVPAPRVGPARAANELGIFRMAWLTDDLDRDHAALVAAGVSCYSPPTRLHMGPGLPDLRAVLWADPNGACLELIESPA